jgi:hypothetical protein
MNPQHVNAATFGGLVEEVTVLPRDGEAAPLVCFYVNTRDSDECSPDGDISERQRCVATGDLAIRLAREIDDGTIIRVEGSLMVNSRAARDLQKRIAKLVVGRATILRPAPTARELVATALGTDDANRCDLRVLARNEVRIVGKVLSVADDDGTPRLTLLTRVQFAATHDVVVWGEVDVDRKVRVGATVEVQGDLAHHVESWPDGQVRLLSRVVAEHVKVFEGTSRSNGPRRTGRPIRETEQNALRPN